MCYIYAPTNGKVQESGHRCQGVGRILQIFLPGRGTDIESRALGVG